MFLTVSIFQFLLRSTTVVHNPISPQTPGLPADCSGKNNTVIIGGGIIGLSTAYYLALAQLEAEDTSCIYIIDSSPELFAAASGHATGILHYDDFVEAANPLGRLSWDLHKDLAAEHDGRNEYSFSSIIASEVRFKEMKVPGNMKQQDELPRWLKNSDRYVARRQPFHTAAGRIDTMKFCQFLLRKCKALGVVVMVNATVKRVTTDPNAISPIPGVIIQQDLQEYPLPCHNLVIAAGPWSQRVLAALYPTTTVKLSMDTTKSASNYLIIRTPGYKSIDDDEPCEQLFLDKVLDHSPDVSTFLGGTMYIGGYGAEPEELPDSATQVHAQPGAVDAMLRLCLRALNVPEGEKLEVVQAGRCYRPELERGYPIIAQVPTSFLQGPSPTAWKGIDPRVFINTGHGSYGVTQGPGSGKVMSKLILNKQPSVNISGLGLD